MKGLYLINLVDEVTQYEFVSAAVGISERFLLPLLEGLLLSFPFPILGFHADNGSEYINHRVAALLDKLRVARFTKSRARHSNDNALVEGKNANVVRKWFGHDHIPQCFAPEVNRFAQGTLSPFLNFHRPCLFATEHRDGNGRIRRKYLAGDVMTPYARLRSIPGAEALLKPGLGDALLDAAAVAETDLEAARRVQAERRELFLRISAGMDAASAAGMTPSRGAGRRGGLLAARAGMAPAGDTMNLTEPAKCQARTDDSGAPSPPTAWGRCAAVKGSLRRPGRLKILGEPRPDSFQSSRQPPTVIAASCPPLTAAPLRLADTLASLAPRRTGRA